MTTSPDSHARHVLSEFAKDSRRIPKLAFIVVALSLAAAGCASSQSTPAASGMSAQMECERGGGVWRPALNVCDYQAPSIPPPRGR